MIHQTLLRHWELPVRPIFKSIDSSSSQTVMPCNLTLMILSVGPNHLGSYLTSPSVNTSVSLAKCHLYSPPILSTKPLWNLAIQRKTLVCGCQAILPRTNKWLNSVQKPTNSSASCAKLLGTFKTPKHVVHFIFLSSGAISATQHKYGLHVHWFTKVSGKGASPCNKTNFEACLQLRNLLPISYWHGFLDTVFFYKAVNSGAP